MIVLDTSVLIDLLKGTDLPGARRLRQLEIDQTPFAIPVIMRATGKTLEQVLDDLANRSGLLGLSGHNDLREIESAVSTVAVTGRRYPETLERLTGR